MEMIAKLWLCDRVVRILVFTGGEDRGIIDANDQWNNIASAQSWLNDHYPEAEQKRLNRTPELDQEWNCAVLGQG